MRTDDHGVTVRSSDGTSPPVADGATEGPPEVRAIAEAAAEAVALINHHRSELRATMAELTSLQRDVRTEVRDLVELVDRLTAAAPTVEPAADEPRSRRWLRRR
mgnify:CR=1 FL=1